jgi:hypothetical protein
MNQRRIEAFLLRLVVGDQGDAHTERWCGRIQHVGSGYERQFDQLHDLIMFIREHMEADAALLIGSDEPISAE